MAVWLGLGQHNPNPPSPESLDPLGWFPARGRELPPGRAKGGGLGGSFWIRYGMPPLC